MSNILSNSQVFKIAAIVPESCSITLSLLCLDLSLATSHHIHIFSSKASQLLKYHEHISDTFHVFYPSHTVFKIDVNMQLYLADYIALSLCCV